jgi:hypothetical protein
MLRIPSTYTISLYLFYTQFCKNQILKDSIRQEIQKSRLQPCIKAVRRNRM